MNEYFKLKSSRSFAFPKNKYTKKMKKKTIACLLKVIFLSMLKMYFVIEVKSNKAVIKVTQAIFNGNTIRKRVIKIVSKSLFLSLSKVQANMSLAKKTSHGNNMKNWRIGLKKTIDLTLNKMYGSKTLPAITRKAFSSNARCQKRNGQYS